MNHKANLFRKVQMTSINDNDGHQRPSTYLSLLVASESLGVTQQSEPSHVSGCVSVVFVHQSVEGDVEVEVEIIAEAEDNSS